MTLKIYNEKWKNVEFDLDFVHEFRLEVSDHGRLRTFNKISNGNIIKGSITSGYNIVRLKFFTKRDEKTEKQLKNLQLQALKLEKKIKALKAEGVNKQEIKETEAILQQFKINVSNKFKADLKKRTIHYHALVHRLVAEYFCKKASDKHILVAHKDFDKLNNKYSNLVWMTSQQNIAHQQNSPFVIEEKKNRFDRSVESTKVAKLTVTKVMLLKKLLNAGKPTKTLVKQFKVTETQILRIKRGENWGKIPAAN